MGLIEEAGKRCESSACLFCKNRKPAYYKYMIKKKGEKEMMKYTLMPEESIQKIRKGDKFFVDGEFNHTFGLMTVVCHIGL